ncbi:hypothetical protein SHIRM173S_12433 [Streptomyces hirsutus]
MTFPPPPTGPDDEPSAPPKPTEPPASSIPTPPPAPPPGPYNPYGPRAPQDLPGPPAHDPPLQRASFQDPAQHDPLAVALGNASLLGVGYLLMRRPGLFWTAAVVTSVLVWTTVATAETWSEVLLLLWWAAVVAHGWLLARRRQGSPRTTQRLVALGLSVAVLLGVGLLRFDAHGIEDDIARARADGDCGAVTEAQEQVWAGHRVAAAPVAARGDRAVDTCERLETAETRLAAGLNGDQDDLNSGFRLLASILEEDSRNDATVGTSLDRFLDGLPTDDACETVRITDWLNDRETEPGQQVLDRSSETADRLAPAALMGCGDALMSTQEWSQAESRYQRLLDEYPGDSREGQARKAIRKAVLALQLEEVQQLVRENRYCEAPAKYGEPRPPRGLRPVPVPGRQRALGQASRRLADHRRGKGRTGGVRGTAGLRERRPHLPLPERDQRADHRRHVPQGLAPGEGVRAAHRQACRRPHGADQRLHLPVALLHLRRHSLEQVRHTLEVRHPQRVLLRARTVTSGP